VWSTATHYGCLVIRLYIFYILYSSHGLKLKAMVELSLSVNIISLGRIGVEVLHHLFLKLLLNVSGSFKLPPLTQAAVWAELFGLDAFD
jgi:hypothetical protein